VTGRYRVLCVEQVQQLIVCSRQLTQVLLTASLYLYDIARRYHGDTVQHPSPVPAFHWFVCSCKNLFCVCRKLVNVCVQSEVFLQCFSPAVAVSECSALETRPGLKQLWRSGWLSKDDPRPHMHTGKVFGIFQVRPIHVNFCDDSEWWISCQLTCHSLTAALLHCTCSLVAVRKFCIILSW